MDLPVGVKVPGLAALDGEGCRPLTHGAGAALHRAGEQPHREGQRIAEPHGTNQGEVQLAIVHAGARGDEAVVPVLVGVGDRDQERGLLDCDVANADAVVPRSIGAERLEGRRNVRPETATVQLVEAGAEVGIEAHAHDVEEGLSVGGARVDAPHATVEQRMEGTRAAVTDAEVAAESVARAAGNQPQHRG